ncbi:hypothetical protein SEA_MARGE_67 [Mycobacterium phage Marge]|nr:hypothetical protein SEA_OOGWAY_69 [Mycobacterium phage Oogway]UIW13392.1 hypothetical protein SEA_MARGE_67 [Mycobacterium phage Marge]
MAKFLEERLEDLENLVLELRAQVKETSDALDEYRRMSRTRLESLGSVATSGNGRKGGPKNTTYQPVRDTIRELCEEDGSDHFIATRVELAARAAVSAPSLMSSLARMQVEGLIDYWAVPGGLAIKVLGEL